MNPATPKTELPPSTGLRKAVSGGSLLFMNPFLEHRAFLTRRQFFGRGALGIGTAALASLATVQAAEVKTGQAPQKIFEPATEKTAVLTRFEALRLGAFISDPMTAGEGEWGSWEQYFKRPTRPASAYRPVKLDVEGWVSALAKAGFQYAVFNAKEGHGFCLWDSKYTDYDVGASNYKTDVLAEFVQACRKHGIAPSFHYCLGKDRYQQRDKGMTEEQYYTYANNQIAELLTQYGPITSIWFSGNWGLPDVSTVSPRRYQQAYETVKAAQPDCLVVVHANRHQPGKGFRLWPTDVYQPGKTLPPAEGHNPRMQHGDKTYYIPYEVAVPFHLTFCPTMSNRPVAEVAQRCRDTIQRGANATIYVEVEPDGTLPGNQVQRLLELKAALESK